MRPELRLQNLTTSQFLANLGVLTDTYAAAMRMPAQDLPARRAVMAHHATYGLFRAVVATACNGGGKGHGVLPVTGFAYGFHGGAGQWWHDLVYDALARSHGVVVADRWLADSFEVAEVHVHPDHQGQGTGRAMLTTLLEGRPERTAVLSTMTGDTPAHRLYLSMGFATLLPSFYFPGAVDPYEVMGTDLPLVPRARRPSRS
ncbi:MAG TPA: GNAT family N-acetyltransferase [Streptosporangiaceae bacterium]|nr:GNAT family N-acetyltransferase [Streptosporangiaceae bacterium]